MSDSIWNPQSNARISAPNFVINQIKQGLLEHKLKPGDRLPSESELVELMGVSRGSVRQAMKALETLGVLSIRPGDGTYVNSTVSGNNFNLLIFALLIARPSRREIIDFRYALERDIFELIFENEDCIDGLLIKLEENIACHEKLLMEDAPVAELVKNDQRFHSLLAESSGNILFQTIYNFAMEYFGQYMLTTATRQNSLGSNYAVRDHQIIVEALRKRDFSAVKLAIKHSVNTWQQYMYEEDFDT